MKRRRTLSDDEREVWAQAMRDTRPVRRARAAEAAVELPPAADQRAALPGAKPVASFRQRHATMPPIEDFAALFDGVLPADPTQAASPQATQPVVATPARSARRAGPPPLANFERRLSRTLARGHEAIDARLDLHGMTRDAAYDALYGFLERARARDARHVLVITGKGRSRDTGRETPPWLAPGSPGVLRRSVPGWLAEPQFRALVVSFSASAPGHGGDGAIFIKLRRKQGAMP